MNLYFNPGHKTSRYWSKPRKWCAFFSLLIPLDGAYLPHLITLEQAQYSQFWLSPLPYLQRMIIWFCSMKIYDWGYVSIHTYLLPRTIGNLHNTQLITILVTLWPELAKSVQKSFKTSSKGILTSKCDICIFKLIWSTVLISGSLD